MSNTVPVVRVGIADLEIIAGPAIIKTSGLGSCVGVILYDQEHEVAGIAHVMLPNSSLAKATPFKRGKYADTAVKELVNRLVRKGARVPRLRAKIAGGAEMFPSVQRSELMRIGPRNVEAIKKELTQLRIKVIGEEVGGNNGRMIEFNTKTCALTIRTAHKGIQVV